MARSLQYGSNRRGGLGPENGDLAEKGGDRRRIRAREAAAAPESHPYLGVGAPCGRRGPLTPVTVSEASPSCWPSTYGSFLPPSRPRRSPWLTPRPYREPAAKVSEKSPFCRRFANGSNPAFVGVSKTAAWGTPLRRRGSPVRFCHLRLPQHDGYAHPDPAATPGGRTHHLHSRRVCAGANFVHDPTRGHLALYRTSRLISEKFPMRFRCASRLGIGDSPCLRVSGNALSRTIPPALHRRPTTTSCASAQRCDCWVHRRAAKPAKCSLLHNEPRGRGRNTTIDDP